MDCVVSRWKLFPDSMRKLVRKYLRMKMKKRREQPEQFEGSRTLIVEEIHDIIYTLYPFSDQVRAFIDQHVAERKELLGEAAFPPDAPLLYVIRSIDPVVDMPASFIKEMVSQLGELNCHDFATLLCKYYGDFEGVFTQLVKAAITCHNNIRDCMSQKPPKKEAAQNSMKEFKFLYDLANIGQENEKWYRFFRGKKYKT